MRAFAALLLASTACGNAEPFLVVTVEPRPAVHDIAALTVTLTNEGTSREDTFEVSSESFPATFSITTPGRSGDLTIAVTATDRDTFLVGRGATTTTTVGTDDSAATVVLDSADFVINTEFAEDQFPSNDFEAHGFQLSADEAGVWTAVYRDTCSAPCNMFARRFDVTGRAVETTLAAGTNQFPISTELSDGFFTTPATATNGDTTVAVWNFSEPAPSTVSGIACRSIDSAGNGIASQVNVIVETSLPFAVSVAAVNNGLFAVAWQSTVSTPDVARTALVNDQCQPSRQLDVSVTLGTSGASRAAVTSNKGNILYAWIVDGEARMRVTSAVNTPVSNDVVAVQKTATETVSFVRVAPLGDGFAVVVRWETTAGTGPGRIELYRVSAAAAIMGTPTLITSRSGSDLESVEGFSVAARADDGALLVAWHACAENGDESGCGVFGRVVRSSGAPVGDEFNLATTIDSDQTSPSVVGLPGAFAALWRDASGKEPDRAGSAVRGRVLYPPFDDAQRVHGATCNSSNDCNEGLACGPATDGGKRCFTTCTGSCPGGGTCSSADTGQACLF